jgi:hypothetical protein
MMSDEVPTFRNGLLSIYQSAVDDFARATQPPSTLSGSAAPPPRPGWNTALSGPASRPHSPAWTTRRRR